MGYSRYGSQGKGLSDRSQRSYDRRRVNKYKKALSRYNISPEKTETLTNKFAVAVGTFKDSTTGRTGVRGVYQIPEKPPVRAVKPATTVAAVISPATAITTTPQPTTSTKTKTKNTSPASAGASGISYGRRHTDPNTMAMRKQAERDKSGSGIATIGFGVLAALALGGMI